MTIAHSSLRLGWAKNQRHKDTGQWNVCTAAGPLNFSNYWLQFELINLTIRTTRFKNYSDRLESVMISLVRIYVYLKGAICRCRKMQFPHRSSKLLNISLAHFFLFGLLLVVCEDFWGLLLWRYAKEGPSEGLRCSSVYLHKTDKEFYESLCPPVVYFLSNITSMVTPATIFLCFLIDYSITCVFMIASEFYC